jgi:hypothetical protein
VLTSDGRTGEPIRRRVALKVEGSAGATEGGLPFFVMELVKGVTLTES